MTHNSGLKLRSRSSIDRESRPKDFENERVQFDENFIPALTPLDENDPEWKKAHNLAMVMYENYKVGPYSKQKEGKLENMIFKLRFKNDQGALN